MNDSKDNTETDIKYGYYRITVTADFEKAFVEASFYSQSEDGRVEEIAVKKNVPVTGFGTRRQA